PATSSYDGREGDGALDVDCGGAHARACPREPHRGPQRESGVDCGGSTGRRCAEGEACRVDADCDVVCSERGRCITTRSCKPLLGGETCGWGEVGLGGARHESCCRSLPVRGFVDP